jgi:hypothetical protein
VWKTLTHDPIVNVSSRYGAMDYDGRKIAGFNNIELITDRSLEENLEEVAAIKREFPNHAMIVSLMVESNQGLARDRQALRGRDSVRRLRAEFRLSARHERARHGLRRRPGAGVCGEDHELGQGSRHAAGAGQAHAEHHGRALRRPRRGARRSGWHFINQYH